MTIQLACGCGRRYQIPDEHAGKKTRCKACGAVHVIPNPEPEARALVSHVVEDTEVVDAIDVDDDETEVMTALNAKSADKPKPPLSDPDAREPPRRTLSLQMSTGVIAAVSLLIVGLLCLLLAAMLR
jgi:hypothetical protein